MTNDLTRTATEIADLDKERWQIELFFKWIKREKAAESACLRRPWSKAPLH